MTKEQVILAYQKKYGHIPDLLARIVTQLDYEYWVASGDFDILSFADWETTKEPYGFWSTLDDIDTICGEITESDYIVRANTLGIPSVDMFEANEILSKAKELHDRKQVFKALKTLVELDAQDGGERVMAASEMQLVDLNDDTTQLSIVVDKQVGRELEKDSKRLLILLFDAAEYDKVDNDGL